MRFRTWFRESRKCWHCRRWFTATKRDFVYCSALCGRLARGLDGHGGPRKREAA